MSPPPPLSALTQLDSRRNSFSKERLAQTAQGWGHCHHHTGGCSRTAALRDVVGGHGRGGPGLDLGISALSFPLPSPAQSSHTATTLPTRASVSPMGGAGGGLTCGWRFGCCCAPSPGTSPGGGRSGRRRCCGCSWGRHTPCSSIGCTPARRCPPPAGPRSLWVKKGGGGDGGAEKSAQPYVSPRRFVPVVSPPLSPSPKSFMLSGSVSSRKK